NTHVGWDNIAIRPSIRGLVWERYGVPRYKERRVYGVLNKRLKLGPVPSCWQVLPCVGSSKSTPINCTPQKIARDAHVWAHFCFARQRDWAVTTVHLPWHNQFAACINNPNFSG